MRNGTCAGQPIAERRCLSTIHPRPVSGCSNGCRTACPVPPRTPACETRKRWASTRSPATSVDPERVCFAGACVRRPAVDVAEFDYELPEELIAQAPLPERDASRLLVLPRGQGEMQHRSVRELPLLLGPGDLLVANDARVIPARLRGRKQGTGGKVELLLVEPLGGADWLALGQAAKPLRAGQRVAVLGSGVGIVEIREGVELVVRLPLEGDALWSFLDKAGELPLPPYIRHAPG